MRLEVGFCGCIVILEEVTMSKYNIDESRQIAVVWDITDVQLERPDLNDEEAMEVLLLAEKKHDANYGIGWQTLRDHADSLFPLKIVPVTEVL
jgi:hypothetical protein